MKYLLHVFIIALFICNLSCKPTVGLYEQLEQLENFEWNSTSQKTFTFNIADTASVYNIYLVVRHLEQYSFNNLRVSIHEQIGSQVENNIYNFPLGKKDKWYGKKIGEVYENRIRFNKQPLHFSNHPYKITLQQRMLETNLKGITQVGIRIQKI